MASFNYKRGYSVEELEVLLSKTKVEREKYLASASDSESSYSHIALQNIERKINDILDALVGNLFKWLKSSQEHLLICSCVFHFEFEFMLNEILKTLKAHNNISGIDKFGVLNGVVNGVVNPKVADLFEYIKANEGLNATQLGKALNIAPRTLSRYLQTLGDSVEYIGSPRKGGYCLRK